MHAVLLHWRRTPTVNTTQTKLALLDSFDSVLGLKLLEKAAALLRETDMSVAEIAGQVGYESQSKFTAAFKEQFGLLPTAYRRT